MEGERYFPLLVIVVICGVALFLPSKIIDLRVQKSLFPMMAIYLFICGLIYAKANRTVGILGAFVLLYTVAMFTTDPYTFFLISIFYLAFYLLAVTFYKDYVRPYRDLLINSLCIFAFVNVLWLVLQHYGIYFFFYPKPGSLDLETGWFANRNEVSVYLAITTPLFFRKRWAWGLIPQALGLALANTTNGAMTAIIVSCAYGVYMLFRKYKNGRMLIVISCFALAFWSLAGYMKFIHTGNISGRMEVYIATLDLIKEKPIFGWGIGQSFYVVPLYANAEKQKREIVGKLANSVLYKEDFKKLYREKHNFNNKIEYLWIHLHNDYEQWTVDTGFVGLFLLLLVIVSHFIAFIKTKGRDVIIGLSTLAILISANAFFTLQMGCFLIVLVLFMAMIQGEYVSQRSAH